MKKIVMSEQSSLLDDDQLKGPSQSTLTLAALHLSVALSPTPQTPIHVRSFVMPKPSPLKLALFRIHQATVFHYLRGLTYLLLISVTFLENPNWCRQSETTSCDQLFAMTSSDSTPVYYYPSYAGGITAPFVKALNLPSIEFYLLLFLALNFVMRTVYLSNDETWGFLSIFRVHTGAWDMVGVGSHHMQPKQDKKRTTLHNNNDVAYSAILLISIISFVYTFGSNVRVFTRIALFVLSSPAILREFKLIFYHVLPEVAHILLLQLCILMAYAWCGTMLFSNKTEQGSTLFSSFFDSMWNLWILITTANFPNIMIPGYTANRWTFLYFGSFVVIAFYFVTNLMLAAVYSNYSFETSEYNKKVEKNTNDNVREAFRLLSANEANDAKGQKHMSSETVRSVLVPLNLYCHHTDMKQITDEISEILFAILDEDGGGTVDEEEFMKFCDLIQLDFQSEASYASYVQLSWPSLYHSESWMKLKAFVASRKADLAIDFFIVLNAIVLGIQSEHELAGDELSGEDKNGEDDSFLEGIEAFFTIFFCIEMVLKVVTMGWKRYWESSSNYFDFLVTMSSIVASIYVYFPNEYNDPKLITYILMVRLLRLGRLMLEIPQFRLIGLTMVEILPNLYRKFLVLFCILYGFCAIGVSWFGGMINQDPENVYYQRLMEVNTEFEENDWWTNNFNDMPSGMVTLFELLVVNNWTITCQGIKDASGNKWVRSYFVSFHIIGVIIINSIVVAFVVDTFVNEWNTNREKKERMLLSNGVVVSEEGKATFNASEITGTKTAVSGIWTAKARRGKAAKVESMLNIFGGTQAAEQ
jgi:hypothetical protein